MVYVKGSSTGASDNGGWGLDRGRQDLTREAQAGTRRLSAAGKAKGDEPGGATERILEPVGFSCKRKRRRQGTKSSRGKRGGRVKVRRAKKSKGSRNNSGLLNNNNKKWRGVLVCICVCVRLGILPSCLRWTVCLDGWKVKCSDGGLGSGSGVVRERPKIAAQHPGEKEKKRGRWAS
ncbi:hypothetical protein LZ32DRAFT_380193 [Colletotrichum eremochloae]|nr:hypothetical protein LZ32DRAFT_380193 [Colletotrichum eremochloae]